MLVKIGCWGLILSSLIILCEPCVGEVAPSAKLDDVKRRGVRKPVLQQLNSLSVSPRRSAKRPYVPEKHHPGFGGYWSDIVGHASIEAGIAGNPWTRSGRNFGQFYSDRANTLTINQIVLSLSHPISGIGSGYGFGFTFEAMYGSDSRFDVTIGLGDRALNGLYQWVPLQAHINLHTPWVLKRGMDFEIGHSYGLMGSEGTTALSRPLYTFNYTSDYIVPFQTIGAIATLHLSSRWDGIIGVDAGNSTSFGRSANNSRPKGYIGMTANRLFDGRLDLHVIGRLGPQGYAGPSVMSPDGLMSIGIGSQANHLMQYSVDFLTNYRISDHLTASFASTWMYDYVLPGAAYGATGYLAWSLTPALGIGLRGEIFRDDTGSVVLAYPGTTAFKRQLRNAPYAFYAAPPTTYGDLTLGLVYEPFAGNKRSLVGKITFRPEIRIDHSLNGTRPFNRAPGSNNTIIRNGDQTMMMLSSDMVLSF